MPVEKIDQLNFGGVAWDIDLPPDATPSILSLTLNGQSPNLASFKLQADSATDTAQTFDLFMPHGTGTLGLEKNTVHYITNLGYQAGASNSTASKRQSARWYIDDVDGITQPYDGMKIAVEVPGTGVGTAGTLLNINGSTQTADWHPVVYNISTALAAHYGTGAIKMFIYDANATMANCMITKGSAVTITGVWKAEGDYNTNTTSYLSYTSTAVTTGTDKHYFIGKRTAASTGTNYYNANLYFLGAGELYAPEVHSPDVEVSNGTNTISITPMLFAITNSGASNSFSITSTDNGITTLQQTRYIGTSKIIGAWDSFQLNWHIYDNDVQTGYMYYGTDQTQISKDGSHWMNTSFPWSSASNYSNKFVVDGTYPNANTTFSSLILGTDGEIAGSSTVLTVKTNVSQPVIEFSSGVSGNGGRLRLLKATGTYDANVTFPSATGTLALTKDFLPLEGGTMTGPLYWKDSTALPRAGYGSEASLSYVLGIRAFADGGQTFYEKKSDFLSDVGKVYRHEISIFHYNTGQRPWLIFEWYSSSATPETDITSVLKRLFNIANNQPSTSGFSHTPILCNDEYGIRATYLLSSYISYITWSNGKISTFELHGNDTGIYVYSGTTYPTVWTYYVSFYEVNTNYRISDTVTEL